MNFIAKILNITKDEARTGDCFNKQVAEMVARVVKSCLNAKRFKQNRPLPCCLFCKVGAVETKTSSSIWPSLARNALTESQLQRVPPLEGSL